MTPTAFKPNLGHRILELERALQPFVAAYLAKADVIGDSDLYDEQPRPVYVTLGDCRRAARVLRTPLKPQTHAKPWDADYGRHADDNDPDERDFTG